jgi:hypothetical protein
MNGDSFQGAVHESILKLLGSSNLTDTINKIAILKHNSQLFDQLKSQNDTLMSHMADLAVKHKESSQKLEIAEAKIDDLKHEVADLETVLEEADIQLSINRVTLQDSKLAHFKEYESMRADLLWEIEQTKKIAAEEILNCSKQLSLGQSASFEHEKLFPQTGTHKTATKTGTTRILRLNQILSSATDSVKLPLVDDSILSFDNQLSNQLPTKSQGIDLLNIRLLECERAKDSLQLKCNETAELLEQKSEKVAQMETRVQIILAEQQRLSNENCLLNKMHLEFSSQRESFHRWQKSTVSNLLGKACHRFKRTSLTTAWAKWRHEIRKSSIVQRVLGHMLNSTLSRSIQKWRQVVQESKYNGIKGNYVQKCKGIELLQKMIDSKFKCAVLKSFGSWRKYMQDLNLSKISGLLDEKCRIVELLQFKVSNMTEDMKRQKEHFQQLQESVLETKVVNGFMNLEEYEAATKKLACFEKENAELRVHIELVNSQMDGVVAQLAAKDMSLSTFEERIQSKSSAIILLESTISEQRQKHDSLEKEVALGAAHSSLLFKELKETRSKLTLSSEENFQLQEQHLGMVQRLDGTSGSIKTLWTERESDMEV